MDTVFSLDNATVVAGDTTIVDSVTWSHRVGEHWAVIGPNGAGKTTLAKVLTGRVPLASGRAMAFGEDTAEVDPRELAMNVGLCSSALAGQFNARHKAIDVVVAAAHGRATRYREDYDRIDFDRARDLMAAFAVDHVADRPYGKLSYGEQQRVQVARAFMADPQALILDEPAASLDVGAREVLLSALTELADYDRAPAMMLITHHLEEIPVGFTHAMIMANGRVVHAGEINSVLTSANLSHVFNTELNVTCDAGRWSARGRV